MPQSLKLRIQLYHSISHFLHLIFQIRYILYPTLWIMEQKMKITKVNKFNSVIISYTETYKNEILMYLGNINYLTKALNNVNSNRNINNYKVFVLFWYINFIGRKYQLLFLQFFCLCFIMFVFFFRFWHMIWSVIWCPVSKCIQLDYSYNTNIKHKNYFFDYFQL